MESSGEGQGEGEHDARDDRATWFAKQLGDGWTEVEPGIYRFDAGVKNENGIRMASPSEPDSESDPLKPLNDLLDALNPASDETDPPSRHPRRLLGRRTRR
jgi:hypothetical protein